MRIAVYFHPDRYPARASAAARLAEIRALKPAMTQFLALTLVPAEPILDPDGVQAGIRPAYYRAELEG